MNFIVVVEIKVKEMRVGCLAGFQLSIDYLTNKGAIKVGTNSLKEVAKHIQNCLLRIFFMFLSIGLILPHSLDI